MKNIPCLLSNSEKSLLLGALLFGYRRGSITANIDDLQIDVYEPKKHDYQFSDTYAVSIPQAPKSVLYFRLRAIPMWSEYFNADTRLIFFGSIN